MSSLRLVPRELPTEDPAAAAPAADTATPDARYGMTSRGGDWPPVKEGCLGRLTAALLLLIPTLAAIFTRA